MATPPNFNPTAPPCSPPLSAAPLPRHFPFIKHHHHRPRPTLSAFPQTQQLSPHGATPFLRSPCVAVGALSRGGTSQPSSEWDEKPYEILPSGKRIYLDEQDVVSFLDPPKDLIPLDPGSYSPAAYLWKKIGDIPEERHHRLLHLLKPRLISRVWDVAGTRYDNSKLRAESASSLLSNECSAKAIEYWNCRKSEGPMPIAWINFFKKALFRCKDGKIYGRIVGGSLLGRFANSSGPLYFTVRQLKEVMSTEEPCDLAYEFGDDLLSLHEYPQGFPKPVLWVEPNTPGLSTIKLLYMFGMRDQV